MEQENKFQNVLFESIFSYASIGMIVSDRNGKIFLMNDYGLKMFQYDRVEIINQSIEVLIPSRFNHKPTRENYEKNPASRPMGIGKDLYGIKKNGEEFSVEISLSHFEVFNEKYFIAFISDIHKRKNAETDLRVLNEELEKKVEERTLDLMEALDKEKILGELKSRFVSIASHEFKTPLSTISSSAFLLSKYALTEDQSKRDKHIQRIQSAVGSLNNILDDFLSEGRIEEGKIQIVYTTFKVDELITEIIQDFNVSLKNGQNLIYKSVGKSIVNTDKSALKHIIENLLSNAIKFSLENTNIDIETVNKNDFLTLKIRDHGLGIPKMDQVHLFERFYRAQNVLNIKGTGLGLHIVSKYIELLKGSIECNSEENIGTEFTIILQSVER